MSPFHTMRVCRHALGAQLPRRRPLPCIRVNRRSCKLVLTELGSNPPSIACRVFHPGAAVGIAFPLLRLIDGETTGVESPPIGRIDVTHVDVEPDWEGRVVVCAISAHHHSVIYLHLGVHDRTVGQVVAAGLPSIERLDQKIDDTLRANGNDVWRDARISLWLE